MKKLRIDILPTVLSRLTIEPTLHEWYYLRSCSMGEMLVSLHRLLRGATLPDARIIGAKP